MGSQLTLLHRRECELCDAMLEELEVLRDTEPLPPLRVVDVDSDPQLSRRHGLHVPVLLLDEVLVCRGRLDVAELRRLLARRQPSARGLRS